MVLLLAAVADQQPPAIVVAPTGTAALADLERPAHQLHLGLDPYKSQARRQFLEHGRNTVRLSCLLPDLNHSKNPLFKLSLQPQPVRYSHLSLQIQRVATGCNREAQKMPGSLVRHSVVLSIP